MWLIKILCTREKRTKNAQGGHNLISLRHLITFKTTLHADKNIPGVQYATCAKYSDKPSNRINLLASTRHKIKKTAYCDFTAKFQIITYKASKYK